MSVDIIAGVHVDREPSAAPFPMRITYRFIPLVRRNVQRDLERLPDVLES